MTACTGSAAPGAVAVAAGPLPARRGAVSALAKPWPARQGCQLRGRRLLLGMGRMQQRGALQDCRTLQQVSRDAQPGSNMSGHACA